MTRRWRGFRRHRDPAPLPAPASAAAPEAGGRVHTLSMAVEVAMVRLAARTSHTVLTGWGVPAETAVLDAALLVVTELATNTVRHARSARATLAIVVAEDHFTIALRDDDPRVPALPVPGAPLASTATVPGRGLAVLADLASDFGGHLAVTPDRSRPGKTISVLLPYSSPRRP